MQQWCFILGRAEVAPDRIWQTGNVVGNVKEDDAINKAFGLSPDTPPPMSRAEGPIDARAWA